MMCFYFPCFDTSFFKKKDIVGDDDGSMSYVVVDLLNDDGGDGGIIGGDDVVDLLGGDYVAVDLLSCDDDDDDDGDKDVGGLVYYKALPPWNRYRAMLKREKERHLDMEFFDLYLKNRKKEEDRRTRILDSRDDFRDGDLYDPEDRDDNGF